MAQQIAYHVIQGGEDLVTPPMSVSPTRASLAINYECDGNGRLRSVQGYERTDGRLVADVTNRTDITAVPGAGPVRGVWRYKDVLYAFRNSSDNTKCVMHKGTVAGWAEVDIGSTLAFTSGGTYVPQVGNTITGATSNKTAIISKVTLTSGSWAGGSAAGTFVIYDQSGAFVAENLNIGANLDVCSIAANSTARTLAPSGKYEFDNYNVLATGSGEKMYGADGKNKAFQFDGTVFEQIDTGYSPDTPAHIKGHKLHLFVAMLDGVVQHSGFKLPTSFDAGDGASYIGVSDYVIGFDLAADETLVMVARNSTHLLYGASSADWSVVRHSPNTGAIPYTIQRFGSPLYLDDRGLTNLSAVQEYGDFKTNSISSSIKPFLDSKKSLVVTSSVCRENGIYRLYYSDGYATSLTFYVDPTNGKNGIGYTRLLYPNPVSCACSCEDSSGNEVMYFGSTNGMVYRQDYGTSFDGAEIEAKLTTHYDTLRIPRNKKRIAKVIAEIEASSGADISMMVRFSNSYGITSDIDNTLEVDGSGGQWDYDKWDQFVWYTGGVNYAHAYVNGTGLSYSVSIRSSSATNQPHTINGITTHYMVRGLQR